MPLWLVYTHWPPNPKWSGVSMLLCLCASDVPRLSFMCPTQHGQCVSTYNTSLSALECPAPHQCPQVARQSFTGDAVQRLPLSSICDPDDFSTQCPASPYTKRCTLGKWWFFFRRKWSPGSTAMASWPRSHQCLEIKMSYSLRFWSALKEATLPWY